MARDRVILAVVPLVDTDRKGLLAALGSPLDRLRGMLPGVEVEVEIVKEVQPSNSGTSSTPWRIASLLVLARNEPSK